MNNEHTVAICTSLKSLEATVCSLEATFTQKSEVQ